MVAQTAAGAVAAGAVTLDRAEEAQKYIRHGIHWSAGLGLIPMLGVDLLAVTSVQFLMINSIAKLYDVPFSKNYARAIISALLGALIPGSLAEGFKGFAAKAIPIVGPVLATVTMPVLSGASTYAVGKIFIMHFESGGNLLNFDTEAMREHFKSAYEEGKTKVKEILTGK